MSRSYFQRYTLMGTLRKHPRFQSRANEILPTEAGKLFFLMVYVFTDSNGAGGNTTALGNVIWTPTRLAPTVWEIGTPDRNAMEFRHGTDWRSSNIYPGAPEIGDNLDNDCDG